MCSRHDSFLFFCRVLIFLVSSSQPIPLELLLISASEDTSNAVTVRSGNRPRQGLVKKGSFSGNSLRAAPHAPTIATSTIKPSDVKGQYWINFVHLGRKYYNLILWANSQLAQRKWLENIVKQQTAMRERSTVFNMVALSEGFFVGVNKVNCAAPFSQCSFLPNLNSQEMLIRWGGRWWKESSVWHG